jgi:hypothetical protein
MAIKILNPSIDTCKGGDQMALIINNPGGASYTKTVSDSIYMRNTDGLKKWYGTKAEYDALTSYDDNTIYITTDENNNTFIDSATFTAHVNNTENPHKVTPSQIGAYTKAETDTKIANAAPNITVDASLSSTSTNPVQNKAVASSISNLQTSVSSIATIYTGTTEPSSSLGKDGDLYVLYTN